METDVKSSRGLDALIAVNVMGYPSPRNADSVDQSEYEGRRKAIEFCPDYSTDIAAAWEVVEKLAVLGYRVTLDTYPQQYNLERAQPAPLSTVCTLDKLGTKTVGWQARTTPLAICAAALKALEG
jgi:hypothetical protein